MEDIYMIKPSSSTLVNVLVKLLTLVLIAKLFSLSLWYYLGENNIELSSTKNYQPQYQRIDFRHMIEKKKIQQVKKVIKKKVTGPSITSMILKGLYGKGENGFAIVALKSKAKKTSIISVSEEFSGYTLRFINAQSVVFEKDSKNYILELKNAKIESKRIKKVVTATTQQTVTQEESDEPQDVSRNDINYFAKHPREIWKNISIHEVRRGKKIIGFRISKIKPNSKFAALGLKSGDLIVKANNITLNSYRNAIDIYNKIDKIDTMQIVVVRDGREKELVYDIN